MNTFITKDSGKRQEYKSGMRRDLQNGKARYDLIDAKILKRWGELMERGASKYGENNWQLANSEEEMNRFRASAMRHLFQWANNWDTQEDHAVAVMFNIMAYEFVKDKINNNKKNK